MNFVFYDLETTGLAPAFNQPLQFAAILTDENFVEIERVDFRCRLARHILPSPQALFVTGISPDQLTDPKLPSLLEFSQRIADLTERWAPSIWIGYNTLKFDEAMLRQTFYQNLLPNVYATQFNGNTRFDILPAMHAAYTRDPSLFFWPTDGAENPVFKLDRLAPANGFNSHNAHDALGDVEATIHLARQIFEKNPALWAELLENVHKSHVQKKIETFEPHELIMRFGAAEPRAYVGCFCSYVGDRDTQAAFFDLDAADPVSLLNASKEDLFKAADGTPKIIRAIGTNKAPALLKIKNPSNEHLRRAKVIADAPEFRQRVGKVMAERFPEDPNAPTKPVEMQIYDDFYSDADKRLLEEFRSADWPRRQQIVASLLDPRLLQLGTRLIALHNPQSMTSKETEQFSEYLRDKWTTNDASKPDWMTIAKAKKEIDDLRAQPDADPRALDAIDAFLDEWSAPVLKQAPDASR